MHDSPLVQSVLDFWWGVGQSNWYVSSSELDLEISSKFSDLLQKAVIGELDDWQETAAGCLALVILIDQFSRNIYRNTPEAFANDNKARAVADHAINNGFDKVFPNPYKVFFYLPFEHSEDIEDQKRSVELARVYGDQNAHYYALIHFDIIHRFGRFPHRNKILGRETTIAEKKFLETGGFSS